MKDFYDKLREEIAEYEGRHDEFIYLAPEWYRLLTNLLDNPRLPSKLKPLVCCAIAYFILPADIIPEEVYGPYGYIDDIFFCASVADRIVRMTGDVQLVTEAWEGEGNVGALVAEILADEEALVEDKANAILEYTGYSVLLKLLESNIDGRTETDPGVVISDRELRH